MLSDEEAKQLVALLRKMTWPVSPQVFDALCESTTVIPIELAVVREGPGGHEVFMVHRDDAYFHGWHITGSLILPGRTIEMVILDIISRELGVSLSTPQVEFVGFRQFMKGNGAGQSSRGQEVSLIHILRLQKDISVPLDSGRQFFPLSDLPPTTLAHHLVVLKDVRAYLGKGKDYSSSL